MLRSTLTRTAGLAGAVLLGPAIAAAQHARPSSHEHLRPTPAATTHDEHHELMRVHFAFDSSELSASDRARLEQLIGWLADNPGMNLVLEGHTDPTGTDDYNAGLATRRGEQVRAALLELGAAPGRIAVAVFGERDLTGEEHRLDRRVEIHATEQTLRQITRATFENGGIAVVWSYVPEQLAEAIATR
jgi:outer membrane protein OmpA-like peptidoglycan-associated protein